MCGNFFSALLSLEEGNEKRKEGERKKSQLRHDGRLFLFFSLSLVQKK